MKTLSHFPCSDRILKFRGIGEYLYTFYLNSQNLIQKNSTFKIFVRRGRS